MSEQMIISWSQRKRMYTVLPSRKSSWERCPHRNRTIVFLMSFSPLFLYFIVRYKPTIRFFIIRFLTLSHSHKHARAHTHLVFMRCESSSLHVTSTKTQTPAAMPSSCRSLPISYVISMQVKNGAHRKLKSVCPEHFQPRENDFHKSKNCLTNSLECFLGNLARKFDEVGGKVKARSFTAAV